MQVECVADAEAAHRGLLGGDSEGVDRALRSRLAPVFLARLERWLAFANRLRGARPPLVTPWWRESFGALELFGLCSAWAATGAQDEPGLLLGRRQANAVTEPPRAGTLRVGLVHHAPEALHPVDAEAGARLRRSTDVLLRGHLRTPDWTSRTRPGGEGFDLVAGPALGRDGGFAVYALAPGRARVEPYLHHRGAWKPDRNAGPVELGGPGSAAASAPARRLRPPDPVDTWAPEPWPLLRPYEHPGNLGGRDAEVEHLLGLLRRDTLVVTVSAASGAGKSSLVRAGLLPRLAAEGVPAVYEGLPAEPGLAGRLLGGLLDGGGADDPDRFAAALVEARALAGGKPPVLVLDQFEEVFPAERAGAEAPALARLGPLLLATARAGRPCRWLLVCRHEYHGRVCAWLRDALRYAGGGGSPLDPVTTPWILPLLGDPGGRPDRERHAEAAFLEAIERPLRSRTYHWTIPGGGAVRLAAAFARARLAAPDDPLVPELQAVLHRLQAEAGGTELEVPVDPDAVDGRVADALATHLRQTLDRVAEHTLDADVAARRTAALLLLHRMVDRDGRRRPVKAEDLADPAWAPVLEALEGRGAWLVRAERREGQEVLTLAHDRVAAEVHRIVTDPAEARRWGLASGVVEAWRFATQRAAALVDGDEGATHVDEARMNALFEHEAALPLDAPTRGWWDGARARHRRALEGEVRRSVPRSGAALRALHRLRVAYGARGEDLAGLLRPEAGGSDPFTADRRDALFGEGPAGLTSAERAAFLPGLVETLATGVVEETPESFWGALLAAAGTAGRVGEPAEAAVVAAMRAARGEPPRLDREDGSWSPVVAGEFEVGSFPGDQGNDGEALHPVRLSGFRLAKVVVTLADYRRFVPGHLADKPWPAEWPAIQVGWYEAAAYAAWRGARLPTEHEWEVACRGGAARRTTPFWCGDERAALAAGWYAENAGRRPWPAAEPKAGAPTHPLGLLHIHGNAWEWCADWYAGYPEDAGVDPRGPAVAPPSAGRVVRGGSGAVPAAVARSAFRGRYLPSVRLDGLGFRLALPQPG